jgi:hypothetical protein
MEPSVERSEDHSDAQISHQPPSREHFPAEGRSLRASRRMLLAFGGLLAGGHAALAAPRESPRSTAGAQARLKLAQEALAAVRANIGRGEFGPGGRDPIAIWSRRRLDARFELSATKLERIAAAQEHLEEMKGLEQILDRMSKAGEVDQLIRMDAEYRRLEAESWLEQEKAKR